LSGPNSLENFAFKLTNERNFMRRKFSLPIIYYGYCPSYGIIMAISPISKSEIATSNKLGIMDKRIAFLFCMTVCVLFPALTVGQSGKSMLTEHLSKTSIQDVHSMQVQPVIVSYATLTH
jgi:hypothetical protein